MDIKDERKSIGNNFGELIPGDVFEFDDRNFIKKKKVYFGDDEDDFYNAVGLVDGRLFTIMSEEWVIPLVVQLRIIRNE